MENPDGTKTRAFEETPGGLESEPRPPWNDAEPLQVIGSLFAAQLAISAVLEGLRVQVGSFENLISTGNYQPVRVMKLHHVTLDPPDSAEEIKPLSATIIERSPQVFEDDHRPYMLKQQWKGLSLRCLSKTTCTLGVVAWFGHKNERRAFRTAFTRAFLAEQKSERGGRAVVVPQYFDQVVRLNLTDCANAGEGLEDHWVLQATIIATVDEIEAVTSPAKIKPQLGVQAGTDVKP